MTEKTVQIQAATHLIVNPKRRLRVELHLAATFACSWDLQISDENGLIRHRLQLPRLPVDLAWTLDESLDPLHTIEIFASTYETAGEDYIGLKVNETATRLVIEEMDNGGEQIDFQATITDPPPLKKRNG